MDITPQENTTQPISDDQELAKALAGVLPEDEDTTKADPTGMQFEETPAAIPPIAPLNLSQDPTATPVDATATPTAPTLDMSALNSTLPTPTESASDLDDIKLDALKELRPLMDKVDLPAEEKFDTYLMLIRSTDDSTLIGPAHAAAQNIADEKRKAEALLEIIKEIDYLSRKDQQPTA